MVQKTKKLVFGLVAMLTLVGVFTSCDKSMDEPVAPVATSSSEQVAELSSGSPQTRSLSHYSAQEYSIDDKYKDSYSHINQFDNQWSSSDYPNGWPGGIHNPGNCSWTNYTMAVGCVGRASGTISLDDYKLDKARRLKKFMKNSRGSYTTGSVMEYIYNDYGVVYDNSTRVGLRHWKTSKAKSNHGVITEELLKHLRDFKTPIVIIGTKDGYGHYFTIVSIVWGGNIDNSDIWFCDSTQGSTGDSFRTSAKSLPLRKFLNNLSNGPSSAYTRCNVLFTYDLNP